MSKIIDQGLIATAEAADVRMARLTAYATAGTETYVRAVATALSSAMRKINSGTGDGHVEITRAEAAAHLRPKDDVAKAKAGDPVPPVTAYGPTARETETGARKAYETACDAYARGDYSGAIGAVNIGRAIDAGFTVTESGQTHTWDTIDAAIRSVAEAHGQPVTRASGPIVPESVAPASAPPVSAPRVLKITHDATDGTVMYGETDTSFGAIMGKAGAGWHFSKLINGGSWYVRRSRGQAPDMAKINKAVELLRANGHTVNLKIDKSTVPAPVETRQAPVSAPPATPARKRTARKATTAPVSAPPAPAPVSAPPMIDVAAMIAALQAAGYAVAPVSAPPAPVSAPPAPVVDLAAYLAGQATTAPAPARKRTARKATTAPVSAPPAPAPVSAPPAVRRSYGYTFATPTARAALTPVRQALHAARRTDEAMRDVVCMVKATATTLTITQADGTAFSRAAWQALPKIIGSALASLAA